MKIPKINSAPFVIGIGIVSFILFNVLLTSIVFLAGGTVSPIFSAVALLLTIGLLILVTRGQQLRRVALQIVSVCAIIVIAVFAALSSYDWSWDGNTYHKIAIGQMKNGWNPVYQKAEDFNNSHANSFVLNGENTVRKDFTGNWVWVNHYPKSSWMYAANLYATTGNIEAGKSQTLLLIAAVLFISYGYLSTKLNRNRALVLSAILAFNPVIVAQIPTYYNDGMMGNWLLLLILGFMFITDKKFKDKTKYWLAFLLIGAAIIIGGNLKFTGLVYAGVISLAYVVYMMIIKDWQMVRRVIICGAVGLVLSVLVVGASAYVKNTIYHHHPLYPLAGTGKIGIMSGNQPTEFENKSGLRKFFEVNLAKTSNDSSKDPSLKVPFTIHIDELQVFASRAGSDIRFGGYGVWFGGILLLCAGAFIYLGYLYKNRISKYWVIYIPIITIIVCVLAFGESWWARYVPHMILIPILAATLLYLSKKTLFANILVFALLFNGILIATLNISMQKDYKDAINLSMKSIDCRSDKITKVYSLGYFDGSLYNIQDRCKYILPVTPAEYHNRKPGTYPEAYRQIVILNEDGK